MGWLMYHSRRSVALVALVVAGLVGSCGGSSASWPDIACAPDLDIGTACLPGDDHLGASQFVDVRTHSAAVEAMSTGTASVTSTRCTEFPDLWSVCISNYEGILAITAVDVPDDTGARFVGSDLDDVEPVSLRAGQTVGVRRDTGVLLVALIDADEAVIGEIDLGFYG